MEHTLGKIAGKPSDYKMCECGRINWYENDNCVDCSKTFFSTNEEIVSSAIDEEYTFYEMDGYSENQIDELTIEI